jgi:hypothetical protein
MADDPDDALPPVLEQFSANMNDVDALLEVHEKLTGEGPGRRRGVEVLNKSAVMLITACWEAFIEDIVSAAFNFMLDHAATPGAFPARVLTRASTTLREDKDERKVWDLAGDGWKEVLRNCLQRTIESFHTPRPTNIDELFDRLLGLKDLSSSWHWQGRSTAKIRDKLNAFIDDRGAIAHRVSASSRMRKSHVSEYRAFIYRLAASTSNRVRTHVHTLVGSHPWDVVKYVET